MRAWYVQYFVITVVIAVILGWELGAYIIDNHYSVIIVVPYELPEPLTT
jgi:hypothetical protein